MNYEDTITYLLNYMLQKAWKYMSFIVFWYMLILFTYGLPLHDKW